MYKSELCHGYYKRTTKAHFEGRYNKLKCGLDVQRGGVRVGYEGVRGGGGGGGGGGR